MAMTSAPRSMGKFKGTFELLDFVAVGQQLGGADVREVERVEHDD